MPDMCLLFREQHDPLNPKVGDSVRPPSEFNKFIKQRMRRPTGKFCFIVGWCAHWGAIWMSPPLFGAEEFVGTTPDGLRLPALERVLPALFEPHRVAALVAQHAFVSAV